MFELYWTRNHHALELELEPGIRTRVLELRKAKKTRKLRENMRAREAFWLLMWKMRSGLNLQERERIELETKNLYDIMAKTFSCINIAITNTLGHYFGLL